MHKRVLKPGTKVVARFEMGSIVRYGEYGTVVSDDRLVTTVRFRGLNVMCFRTQVRITRKSTFRF